METKICTKCDIEKDVTEFHQQKRRNGKQGYHSRCKLCIKEIASSPEYKAKAVQRTLKWNVNNPERVKTNRISYQAKIRGTEKYREYHRDNQRKKYHNDPEFRSYMISASKKYEKTEAGKKKRREIAKRWIENLSDIERKEYFKRQSLCMRNTYKMQINTLHDSYISKLLVGYVDKTIPKEIIEAKRLIVKINRALVKRGIRVR